MLTIKPAWVLIILLSFNLLLGCQGTMKIDKTMTPSLGPTASPGITVPPTTEPTLTTLTPTLTSTVTASSPGICSPLAGYSLSDLEKSIVNPYLPPPPGIDRPHQGLDLAILEAGSNVARSGESVQVILTGIVSAVIQDRFPYGNAVLVESPLLSGESLEAYLDPMPTPWEEVQPDPALTCPHLEDQQSEHEKRSIYILYAHLLESPSFALGGPLRCGETIGRIGMSGNALNPHLHIESRLGPSGAQFESMAHYDSSATPAEMGAYCQWRVSGIFQHFDPMILLQGVPELESH
jgi:murein DD-endopeptidase MepM/ murein hydrolase activator NlpD